MKAIEHLEQSSLPGWSWNATLPWTALILARVRHWLLRRISDSERSRPAPPGSPCEAAAEISSIRWDPAPATAEPLLKLAYKQSRGQLAMLSPKIV